MAVVAILPIAIPSSAQARQQDRADSEMLGQRVARLSSASTVSDAHRCLARAVYAESKGEPLQGQLAIAQVVINRTRAGDRFPSSICAVVHQPGQFTDLRRLAIDYGGEAWKRAVGIARIAMSDQWEQMVGGALYFHASYVAPNWPFKRVGRIGRHIFYR